jgi:hypothetical protein
MAVNSIALYDLEWLWRLLPFFYIYASAPTGRHLNLLSGAERTGEGRVNGKLFSKFFMFIY